PRVSARRGPNSRHNMDNHTSVGLPSANDDHSNSTVVSHNCAAATERERPLAKQYVTVSRFAAADRREGSKCSRQPQSRRASVATSKWRPLDISLATYTVRYRVSGAAERDTKSIRTNHPRVR